MWSRRFSLSTSNIPVKQFMYRKVLYCPEKKIAEFNYKMFTNILICGYTVNKWNKQISSICEQCQVNHTIEHLIYECNKVKHIWQLVGDTLKVDLSWYKIMFGFLYEGKQYEDLCHTISLIAFCIYKTWVLNNNDIHKHVIQVIRHEMNTRVKMLKDENYKYVRLKWNRNLIERLLNVL